MALHSGEELRGRRKDQQLPPVLGERAQLVLAVGTDAAERVVEVLHQQHQTALADRGLQRFFDGDFLMAISAGAQCCRRHRQCVVARFGGDLRGDLGQQLAVGANRPRVFDHPGEDDVAVLMLADATDHQREDVRLAHAARADEQVMPRTGLDVQRCVDEVSDQRLSLNRDGLQQRWILRGRGELEQGDDIMHVLHQAPTSSPGPSHEAQLEREAGTRQQVMVFAEERSSALQAIQ